MKISLIVPCYNEVTNIQKGVLDKIGNFTKHDNRFQEVVIVDDGSSDSTKEVIKNQYLPKFSKFKLIENQHHGKAMAITTGIQKASADYVMFSDIDLATPIEESLKLIEAAEHGHKIIIGSRTANRDGAPLTRKLLAFGFIYIRNVLFGFKGIKDTQCGFKMFEKEAAQKIIDKSQIFRNYRQVDGPAVTAAFDLEFLFLGNKLGYTIKEIPVIWRHVETKNVNFLKDTIETLRDIYMIKTYEFANKYNF